jgi:hypothetical protein
LDYNMNIKQATAKVSKRLEMADLNDAQIVALRTRVLPIFDTLDADLTAAAKPEEGKKSKLSDPELRMIWEAHYSIRTIQQLLKAVVGQGTPALRASKLEQALRPQRNATVTVDKILLSLIKELKRIITYKGISKDGRASLEDFLADPTLKLLKGSWSFIVEELIKEVPSILKKHKLLKAPPPYNSAKGAKGPSSSVIVDRFTTYCKSKGFVFEPSKDGKYKYYEDGCIEASKPILEGAATIVLTCVPTQGVAPAFRVGAKPATYGWGCTGVDSGVNSWGEHNTVEALIDYCIDKCEQAIPKRLEQEKNGTMIDFGGRKQLLLPAKLAEVVKLLKSGRTYAINPSGFGTQYLYTTVKPTGGFYAPQKASDQITRLVGKQVYYTTHDLD